MPGFEPFLLCDLHIHTRWSDGDLGIRDVCDLYGQTGHFDVIAITDHILMQRDWLGRAGRLASFGARQYSVTHDRFVAYLDEIATEADRAWKLYGLLVLPGAEITQNHLRASRNSHIIGLGIQEWISADQSAADILREIRRQDAVSIACHPCPPPIRRFEIATRYLWDHRYALAPLVDAWEAGNRRDLFPVTTGDAYAYVANSDFHKPGHLHSWKTLLRAPRTWDGVRHAIRHNIDVGVVLYRPGPARTAVAAPVRVDPATVVGSLASAAG